MKNKPSTRTTRGERLNQQQYPAMNFHERDHIFPVKGCWVGSESDTNYERPDIPISQTVTAPLHLQPSVYDFSRDLYAASLVTPSIPRLEQPAAASSCSLLSWLSLPSTGWLRATNSSTQPWVWWPSGLWSPRQHVGDRTTTMPHPSIAHADHPQLSPQRPWRHERDTTTIMSHSCNTVFTGAATTSLNAGISYIFMNAIVLFVMARPGGEYFEVKTPSFTVKEAGQGQK